MQYVLQIFKIASAWAPALGVWRRNTFRLFIPDGCSIDDNVMQVMCLGRASLYISVVNDIIFKTDFFQT